jgi:hypothetical protein
MTKDIRTFFKEQWISIIAVGTSLSVTHLLDAMVGVGSLTKIVQNRQKSFESSKGS